jgi:polyphosphate kinase
MSQTQFFNRDISWLSFNERVLQEAAKPQVPLLERLRFLAIYSSNLDEFYRVRIPVLMSNSIENKINPREKVSKSGDAYHQATEVIKAQLSLFGKILNEELIPSLRQQNIVLVYNQPIPELIISAINNYFFDTLSAHIQLIKVEESSSFFPENNQIYLAVFVKKEHSESLFLVTIPSASVNRFFSINHQEQQYIVFIDDILKHHLLYLFPESEIKGAYSIKITRDADLHLQDNYEGDMLTKIENQVAIRDLGMATRFLHPSSMPKAHLKVILDNFSLNNAVLSAGGNYHNLKDFSTISIPMPTLNYPKQTPIKYVFKQVVNSLFTEIQQQDILINTPYESYSTILRFFNEASVDASVTEICTTMYRVANDSSIVHALINAAKNGKKVMVFVELKARFDESNNIKWAKKMKAAGIKIIYSIPNLKVHAKVALVKRMQDEGSRYVGLLATGNLNESTARFYTDHILMTAQKDILRELDLLFMFLSKRTIPEHKNLIDFKHLLVAQFNLQDKFLSLIDHEIQLVKQGKKGYIILKVNNLEEEVLISKLYEASQAGVKIDLIVRSICRAIPQVKGMSENIIIKRIVDRYLEHGRVFIFHNDGDEQIFMGSSDWMNRNIYSRIEVCFPIYDPTVKKEMRKIIDFQLADDGAAVRINEHLDNVVMDKKDDGLKSQAAIYDYCVKK